MASNQLAIIAEIKKKLERKYQESTEMFPDFTTRKIEVIPSKSTILNAVTGIGGIPRGRVTEIFGLESTGKTTLASEITASLQKLSPSATTLFLDYEHAFDPHYAKKLGQNLAAPQFVYVQPDSFEQGHEVIHEFLEADAVDLIIIDSAAAMTPQVVLDSAPDDSVRIGIQAAKMADLLTKVTKQITKGRKPAFVVLNQMRANINLQNQNEPNVKAAGGNAMKFYASLRLQLELVRKEGDSKRNPQGKGTDQIFTQISVRVTAIKNKLASPFMRGLFVIDYGKGTNNIVAVADIAEQKLGIMSGAGFFKYDGATKATTVSGRGREAFQAMLASNPALFKELEAKVLQSMADENAKSLGVEVVTAQEVPDIVMDEKPASMTLNTKEAP